MQWMFLTNLQHKLLTDRAPRIRHIQNIKIAMWVKISPWTGRNKRRKKHKGPVDTPSPRLASSYWENVGEIWQSGWYHRIDVSLETLIWRAYDSLCLYIYLLILKDNSQKNLSVTSNMNHFDVVDFSECHSEEVISFFWRSVYLGFKEYFTSLKWRNSQYIYHLYPFSYE